MFTVWQINCGALDDSIFCRCENGKSLSSIASADMIRASSGILMGYMISRPHLKKGPCAIEFSRSENWDWTLQDCVAQSKVELSE